MNDLSDLTQKLMVSRVFTITSSKGNFPLLKIIYFINFLRRKLKIEFLISSFFAYFMTLPFYFPTKIQSYYFMAQVRAKPMIIYQGFFKIREKIYQETFTEPGTHKFYMVSCTSLLILRANQVLGGQVFWRICLIGIFRMRECVDGHSRVIC